MSRKLEERNTPIARTGAADEEAELVAGAVNAQCAWNKQISDAALRRGDEHNIGKIGAIASGVARDESPTLGFSVRSDVKIRQR